MKKKLKFYLIKGVGIWLFLLLLQHSFAQAVRTSVSKKDILIGEQIKYVIQIDLPSAEYNIALTIPDSVPHFDILQKSGGKGVDKQGNNVWQQTIIFTSFDSGSWKFPSFVYRINRRNTSSQPLITDTFRINVSYMTLDKGGNPRDIKSVIEVEYFDWFWVWVGAGLLLLLLLAYFLYRYFRKRKNKVPDTKIGAYDEAIKSLEQLRSANKQQALPVKEFHTRLTDIFKNYYGRSVHREMQSKTTNEILTQLKSNELRAETQAQMSEALRTGDAVKYAKYHSTYTENEAAINYLKTTVEELEKMLTKKP